MSSIWFEEVDKALLEELRKSIKVYNNYDASGNLVSDNAFLTDGHSFLQSNGVLVPLPEKAFVVRKPEEDFKFEMFPCVSIYNLSSNYSALRHYPYPVVLDRDEDNSMCYMEEHAIPFDFEYQIDFWAKYQSDMNDMTRTWLYKHFRQFNLEIFNDYGMEDNCNVFCTSGGFMKSDLVRDKQRLFHSIIKYRIWVEIDGEIEYDVPMVTSVNIGASDKK